MAFDRPLRGRCLCGRNRYIITFPKTSTQLPQVLFNHNAHQRFSHGGSPLSAYLRVPLQYYFSSTFPLCPDETSSMIHKMYPSDHEQRRFCGFCGTPLSYWSEEPRSEADYIQLALGSLFPEDLADLEDLGLLPETDDEEVEVEAKPKDQDTKMLGGDGEEQDNRQPTQHERQTVGGLPWLDSLTEGSRLGTLRSAKGSHTNPSGTVKVEWEIVEWTEDDAPEAPKNGKRKMDDRDHHAGVGPMEGVQQ
ncbi:hypothetical protein B0T16DRAFT_458318 [Cercophora newfieldiana]|uniref:CENP-V/GFA domain-containing protein n=1 Tax=Cercophora newfieldiana TaxID=92897 RepID=A0AA39Y5H2_9PEZI|nr:hypothetical protein B0T16DRAFT_458318 [Cercophora newfieldiana]